MRQLILFVATIMLGTYSFAEKNSSNLNQALHSALTTQPAKQAKLDSHHLAMVYGGADIANQATLTGPITTV